MARAGRQVGLHKLFDPVVFLLCINGQAVHLCGEEVPDDPVGQIQIGMEQGRGTGVLFPVLDVLPEALQKIHIGLKLLFGDAFTDRADNIAFSGLSHA